MFTAIKFEQISNFYVDYKEKNSPYMNVMAQSHGFYSNEIWWFCDEEYLIFGA